MEDRKLDPLGEHLISNCGKMNLLSKLLIKLKVTCHAKVNLWDANGRSVATAEHSLNRWATRFERAHSLTQRSASPIHHPCF